MANNAVIRWYGEEFKRKFAEERRERMEKAAYLVAIEMERLISTPFPPASAPGEPPHTRQEEDGLLGAVKVRSNGKWFEVVADKPYAIHLELGTMHMAPRPFMAVALRNKLAEVQKIVGAPYEKLESNPRVDRAA